MLSIEEDQMSWIKSIKPVKLNVVVSWNDLYPVMNVVNWGRSNELNQINHTGQTQWSCVFECIADIACIYAISERNIWWEWENERTGEGDGGCVREWATSCSECC